MNKLIAIPIILLLASSYFVFRNDTFLSDTTDENAYLAPDNNPGCQGVTFTQWKKCAYEARIPKCDDQPEKLRPSCYQASYLSTLRMWPSVPSASCPCQQFWKYYEKAQANDFIDANGYYHQCFTKIGLINDAQSDSFFYNKIFAPQYLRCAGIKVY